MPETVSSPTFKAGLQDVIATSSDICFIDGDQGVLSYRGFDIHDLAEQASVNDLVEQECT